MDTQTLLDRPVVPPGRILLFSTALAVIVSGCSFRSLVVSSLAGSFAGLEDLYRTENDPELVRESLPANLKMLDLLILQSPDDVNLLLAGAQAYTTYGYAFIMRDAEKIMLENLYEWKRLRGRAGEHFFRAKEYAFRAMEVRHPGFSSDYAANPVKALQNLTREDVPVLYWMAASWANLISASRDDPEAIVDLPHIGMIAERALKLHESYDQGALHEFMIPYSASRPDRADHAFAAAADHFQRALALSEGKRASLFVTYAESVSVMTQDRDEFLAMLDRALSVDVDAIPQSRLSNLIAQERATWLKGRVDALFY